MIFRLLMLSMVVIGTATALADEPVSDVAVKAAFLLRFGGYIEWPESAMMTPQYTIAVLGADELANELRRLATAHLVRGRAVKIRSISTLSETGDSQVLFVGARSAVGARSLMKEVGRRPILLVTEDRSLEDGGIVNFMTIDRRVRFEVSLNAADRAGLKVSSELLAVAARVQGGALGTYAAVCFELRLIPLEDRVCGTKLASL